MDILPSFEFEGKPVRMVADENGTLLWCATDVAKALGYTNVNDAIKRHCKGVVKHYPLKTAGGKQKVRFITEGDVYRLIVNSKLPNAEEFERVVFEEILPSVRKTGAYMTEETIEKALTNPDFLIQLATQLKTEQEERRKLERQAAINATKVIFADAVSASDNTILIRDLAKLLRQNGVQISGKDCGEKRLYEWLRNHGYIMKAKRGSSSYNLPTQKAMNLGLFVVRESVQQLPGQAPKTRYTTRVTGKGQRYFIELFMHPANRGVLNEIID